jgi:hypothetical protein
MKVPDKSTADMSNKALDNFYNAAALHALQLAQFSYGSLRGDGVLGKADLADAISNKYYIHTRYSRKSEWFTSEQLGYLQSVMDNFDAYDGVDNKPLDERIELDALAKYWNINQDSPKK